MQCLSSFSTKSLPVVTDFPVVPSCHPNSQHSLLPLHTYLADMKTCPVILKHLNCFNISLQTALPIALWLYIFGLLWKEWTIPINLSLWAVNSNMIKFLRMQKLYWQRSHSPCFWPLYHAPLPSPLHSFIVSSKLNSGLQ